MKIAVFGGSFDPPHLGHEQIVLKALEDLDIDKLIVIPTYLNPFKKQFFLEASLRYKLVQLLFEDILKVEVCDYEFKQEKPIQTIQTIRYLNSLGYDDIIFIIGADNLEKLHLWDEYNILKELVTFVVASRDNIKIDNFKTLNINCDISSTRIRENLDITLIPDKIQEEVKRFWKKE